MQKKIESFISTFEDVDTDYVTQSDLETRLENIGGGNAGRNIGEIRYVVSTSSISVTSGITLNDYDIEELYVGGIVGNIQGVLRFLYVRNNNITIGSPTRSIVARTGSAGTFMGGVVGAVGMGIMGAASGGEKEFCRTDDVCEDINM